MSIIIKNKQAIIKMRKAGELLAGIFEKVSKYIQPGMSTLEINNYIENCMKQEKLFPYCKGYAGYKYATCISLNDVIVHGVPSANTILKEGDFLKIDAVGSYKSYCADMTRYFFIGKVSQTVIKIAATAQKALDEAIAIIKPGIYLYDISAKIQKVVENEGFGIVKDFAGHGIGKNLHEPPEIPNYGKAGTGILLQPGMTLAIEPMITENSPRVIIEKDGWTARTADNGLAAHVEDTILVTPHGCEVLTRI